MHTVWTEYTELLTDGAHWAFEITTDLILGAIFYPIGVRIWHRWVRKHDKEVHGHE
jgi:hypothetical protein